MRRLKLAILISGRGSNMSALLDACKDDAYPAEPALVVSNRPDARGLELAAERGVRTCAIDHKPFGKNRQAFEAEITQALEDAGAEIIALAGFMRILTPSFVQRWSGRLINIHPSLLPKYPGLQTHARAIEAGDREAGASVHWVTEGVDEGGVIAQRSVPILPGDVSDTLEKRVLSIEHELYVRALKIACESIIAGES